MPPLLLVAMAPVSVRSYELGAFVLSDLLLLAPQGIYLCFQREFF